MLGISVLVPRPTVADAVAKHGPAMRDAADEAVLETTEATHARARALIAGTLGSRAGNLIARTRFLDAEGRVVGFVHSRWFRRRGGGKTVASGTTNANDVLAAHAQRGGLTIRPVNKRYLHIGLGRQAGRAGRGLRLNFRDPNVRLFRRPGGYVVMDGGIAPRSAGQGPRAVGRGRARASRYGLRPFATLRESVHIPQAFDMEPVRAWAETKLSERLLVNLAKKGIA